MYAELVVMFCFVVVVFFFFLKYKLHKMIIGFSTFSVPINPIFYYILIFSHKL